MHTVNSLSFISSVKNTSGHYQFKCHLLVFINIFKNMIPPWCATYVRKAPRKKRAYLGQIAQTLGLLAFFWGLPWAVLNHWPGQGIQTPQVHVDTVQTLFQGREGSPSPDLFSSISHYNLVADILWRKAKHFRGNAECDFHLDLQLSFPGSLPPRKNDQTSHLKQGQRLWKWGLDDQPLGKW